MNLAMEGKSVEASPYVRVFRQWILENQANRPVFNALQRKGKEHLIESVGKDLRGMMSWIDEGDLDIEG